MELTSSFRLNSAPLWGFNSGGREATTETFRRGFELCVVSHDAHSEVVSRAVSRSGDTVLVKLPAALSSSDLKQARAITRSSWYMLSGNHRNSTLWLKMKAAAAVRFRETVSRVISHGDQIAILLNGEVIGLLMFQRQLSGDEIAIDASFFSEGTENEKECETRSVARQISSTLY